MLGLLLPILAAGATTGPTTTEAVADHAAFLHDLAVVLIVAGLVTIVFHQLRQPVVLGYIIAGVIVGPHTGTFISINDEATVRTLSELGVILLMFSLGLHFSLRQLMRVGLTALVAASLEILLMIFIGYEIGRFFGWGQMDSIFLGAILSISSTTIIIKALQDLGLTKQRFSEIVFGILIVEDILAIAMIALLSGVAQTGSVEGATVVKTLWQLIIFLAAVLVVGLLVVPKLLRYVAKFKSNEMLLIATLGLCFGVSLLALQMEYSVALGAFLIGAIIAEARESGKIAVLIEPVRDMFSAIFFVAIGMMIDPQALVEHKWTILIITVAVVLGKLLSCSLGTFITGNDPRTSVRVGMTVSQIGEFSFIIAQLGLTLGVTSDFLYPIAVTVSAITTLLTPYLIRSSDPLVKWIERVAPKRMTEHLELYGQWYQRVATSRQDAQAQVRRLLRKWMLQIALNVVLIVAIFVTASWVARKWGSTLVGILPGWAGGANTVLWLAAMLLALPLIVANLRKIRAAAMVLAEMTIRSKLEDGSKRENVQALRSLMANTIVVFAAIALGLVVLLFSAATLPPWPVLIVLLVLVAGITVLLWQHFVRIYARAQIALRDTFAETTGSAAEHHHDEHAPALPAALRGAEMETVVIPADSPAAGKLIRELALRSNTGVSVVAIERNGTSVVNPGPDDELQAGDSVYLLGTTDQMKRARELLTAHSGSLSPSRGEG